MNDYERQLENITGFEALERTELAAQGQEMNTKIQKLEETKQKQLNNIMDRESDNRSKNEVLEIKNQSGRDDTGIGLFFSCIEEPRIGGSPMFDMREEPMTEPMTTVEVLDLGSAMNPPQELNKVEHLDDRQLQPCAAVQLTREPWDLHTITERLILCLTANIP